jgi:hypothetical protein
MAAAEKIRAEVAALTPTAVQPHPNAVIHSTNAVAATAVKAAGSRPLTTAMRLIALIGSAVVNYVRDDGHFVRRQPSGPIAMAKNWCRTIRGTAHRIDHWHDQPARLVTW